MTQAFKKALPKLKHWVSEKPEKVAELVQRKNVPATPADLVKDEHIFEFMGFKHKILEKSELEDALPDHFTTAGNDNLFVSKYQLHLPTKEKLEEFMRKEMERLG